MVSRSHSEIVLSPWSAAAETAPRVEPVDDLRERLLVGVTSDRYGHLYDGHDDDLLDRLDERFRLARGCASTPEVEVVGIDAQTA